MENHRHCPYCGDMIKLTENTCTKALCIRLYELKDIRCSTPNRLEAFKPGECVLDCAGYKVHENPLDGFICYQLGPQLPNPPKTRA
jgi:hypothetical protein